MFDFDRRDRAPKEAQPERTASADPTPAPRHDAPPPVSLREPGKPLDAAVRDRVEATVGAELGDVRVHDGPDPAAHADAAAARALTWGSHIVLGSGESATDVALIAHEAAHVVQQRPGDGVSAGEAYFEAEARATASAALRGERVVVAGRTGVPVVQRQARPGATPAPTPARPPTPAPAAVAPVEPATIRMILAADDRDVIGHTWIVFVHPDGRRESMGYYATNELEAARIGGAQGALLTTATGVALLGGVTLQGRVVSPDDGHTPTQSLPVLVTRTQYERAVAYAATRSVGQYQLYTYNCTSFARGVYQAATGVPAPPAGALFDGPAALADHIRRRTRRP